MVSMIALITLGALVLWFVTGAINVAFFTITQGYQSQSDKRIAVIAGPILFIFVTGITIYHLIIVHPIRWSAIAGCRLAAFIERFTK